MSSEKDGPGAPLTAPGADSEYTQQQDLDTRSAPERPALEHRSPDGQRKRWRDCIKVHPAAEFLPSAAADELAALGADIKVNGLQSKVVLLRTKDGAAPVLIDGCSRLDSMELSGLDTVGRDGKLMVPHEIIEEREGFNPAGYVMSANVHRRHLTSEQRAEVIRKLKAARPELSIRAVAELTGTPKSTVADALNREASPGVRNRTPAEPAPADIPEPRGVATASKSSMPKEVTPISGDTPAASQSSDKPLDLPPPATVEVPPSRVIGRDCKSYPAKRGTTARVKKLSTPPAQVRDWAIDAFAKLLHTHLPETLADLGHLLRDEQFRIADIAMEKRVSWAQVYLAALGVAPRDLALPEGSA